MLTPAMPHAAEEAISATTALPRSGEKNLDRIVIVFIVSFRS
jgi:hypothetical protein